MDTCSGFADTSVDQSCTQRQKELTATEIDFVWKDHEFPLLSISLLLTFLLVSEFRVMSNRAGPRYVTSLCEVSQFPCWILKLRKVDLWNIDRICSRYQIPAVSLVCDAGYRML